MNRISQGCFVASALAYVGMMLAPYDDARGWKIWIEIGDYLRTWSPNIRDFVPDALLFVIVTMSFFTLASPMLCVFLKRSRLAWWLAAVLACSSLALFTVLLIQVGIGDEKPLVWSLVVSQVLLVTGLFFVRKEPQPEIRAD